MIQYSDLNKLVQAQPRCTDSPLWLIGVRGALAKSYEKPDGLYDDLIFFLDRRAGSFTAWLASVDPSLPLIANPINPDGAAQLAPGVHLFAQGIHKEHPDWPCLVQAEDFRVFRLDANGVVKGQESGDFGIHMHSGGMTESTERFSAGCQIIHNGDGYFQAPTWPNFIQPIFRLMGADSIKTIPYLLENAWESGLDFTGIATLNPVTP